MLSKKMNKRIVSFCEGVKGLLQKIEDAKDLVEETQQSLEKEGTANFSDRVLSKFRKFKKVFSAELLDEIKDAEIDAEEIAESDELNFTAKKKLNGMRKVFKEFGEDLESLREQVSKASAAAAATVEAPKAPETIAPATADEVTESTGEVDKKEALDGAPNAVKSTGELNVPEAVNFSKIVKNYSKKVFAKFEEICDHCKDLTERTEDFTESMTDEIETCPECKMNPCVCDEVKEDDKSFCNKSFEENVDEESTEDDEEVSMSNFTELEEKLTETTDQIKEVADKESFSASDRRRMKKLFCDLGTSLDAISQAVDDKNADETAEVIENIVEFCKNMSKRAKKFSSKRTLRGIIKGFEEEIPSMIDELKDETESTEECEECEEAPTKFARRIRRRRFSDDAVTDTDEISEENLTEEVANFEDQDEQINDKIDESEVLDEKIEDKEIVQFAKIARKALKMIKCFSEEDVESKAAAAIELVETVEGALPSTSKEAEVVKEQFSEDTTEDTTEEAPETEETPEVEETEETEEVVDFGENEDGNKDIIAETLAENAPEDEEVVAEVQETPEQANFGRKVTTKVSSYGAWLTRQARM